MKISKIFYFNFLPFLNLLTPCLCDNNTYSIKDINELEKFENFLEKNKRKKIILITSIIAGLVTSIAALGVGLYVHKRRKTRKSEHPSEKFPIRSGDNPKELEYGSPKEGSSESKSEFSTKDEHETFESLSKDSDFFDTESVDFGANGKGVSKKALLTIKNGVRVKLEMTFNRASSGEKLGLLNDNELILGIIQSVSHSKGHDLTIMQKKEVFKDAKYFLHKEYLSYESAMEFFNS